MRIVVWGHGKSWIVREVDADGKAVRLSHWHTSKEDAEATKLSWKK